MSLSIYVINYQIVLLFKTVNSVISYSRFYNNKKAGAQYLKYYDMTKF